MSVVKVYINIYVQRLTNAHATRTIYAEDHYFSSQTVKSTLEQPTVVPITSPILLHHDPYILYKYVSMFKSHLFLSYWH